MGAIGEELCASLADGRENLPKVTELFTVLAARPGTQYSYENAIVAVDSSGTRAGALIAYDGALLHKLRREFAHEANRILGWDISDEEVDQWDDEADAGEIYLDSLYVVPQFRRQGIATRMINAAKQCFASSGKPLGLLVEPENRRAKRLYESIGFTPVGVSNFFRTPMIHEQYFG